MAHQKNWKMPAQVIRVVDGDNVVLNCDLGFRVNLQVKACLYGINAFGTFGTWRQDRSEGMEAKRVLEDIIEDYRIDDKEDPHHPWLLIETHKNKSDSFGRWIVRLIGKDDIDLNKLLVLKGVAYPADYGSDQSPYWPNVPTRNF